MSYETIRIKTGSRTQLKDITVEVSRVVEESGVREGMCAVYVPHTTAGVCINEAADPDVARDIGVTLDRLAPKEGDYKHFEGNADSHVKATLVGASEMVPIVGGQLALGRWQGIFFCEFDGPRAREVHVRVLGEKADD